MKVTLSREEIAMIVFTHLQQKGVAPQVVEHVDAFWLIGDERVDLTFTWEQEP